jgi:hypothetical protein
MVFAKEIIEQVWVSVRERSLSKGFKPKVKGRKLRSGAYCQGALEQKGVKQAGH